MVGLRPRQNGGLVGQPAKQRETNRGLAEDVGGALWMIAGATTARQRLPRSGAAASLERPVHVDSSRGARLLWLHGSACSKGDR
ncbi:hypothetical protein NL676_020682 [Syzygium grande]|nr:hypothetical protein NL676_020682 [Syzygium grande]